MVTRGAGGHRKKVGGCPLQVGGVRGGEVTLELHGGGINIKMSVELVTFIWTQLFKMGLNELIPFDTNPISNMNDTIEVSVKFLAMFNCIMYIIFVFVSTRL